MNTQQSHPDLAQQAAGESQTLVGEDGVSLDPGPGAGTAGTSGRLPQGAARRPSTAGPVSGGGFRHVVERYRRAVEPAVRGVAGVVLTVAVFAAAGAVGGRAGLAIASVWVTVAGTYCLANFWHCRETHCVVTGLGWTLAAALGFAAAITPGAGLSWYRVTAQSAVFVVILAAGYGLECVVAARTGRRVLRREGPHAQDR